MTNRWAQRMKQVRGVIKNTPISTELEMTQKKVLIECLCSLIEAQEDDEK